VLVAAAVEAFVSAKLDRTDISTALYGAASEPEGATPGDTEFVALMLYSVMAGATRAVLEAGASAKLVVRLREELPVLCQAHAAKSVPLDLRRSDGAV
jgi:hypothetical protein